MRSYFLHILGVVGVQWGLDGVKGWFAFGSPTPWPHLDPIGTPTSPRKWRKCDRIFVFRKKSVLCQQKPFLKTFGSQFSLFKINELRRFRLIHFQIRLESFHITFPKLFRTYANSETTYSIVLLSLQFQHCDPMN